MQVNSKILDNIDQIGREKWDAVFGGIPESYSFYRALENSELIGFRFYYLVMECDSEVVLIAPLFLADFNLDIAVEGWLSKIIKPIRRIFPRFLIINTLFCGSPFGEHGVLGVSRDYKKIPQLIPFLSEGIMGFSRKIKAPLIIFKDFLKQDRHFLDALVQEGFSRVESFPGVVLELNFSSFEGYIKSLGSSTRKNLNKKIRLANERGNIEVKVACDAGNQIDQIFKLYENTYQSGQTKFERLTKKFFLQVSHDLSQHARFFLFYVEGRLAAFNLCFVYDDLLIDKFVGFDYDISNRYNLYFVSWAYNIKWCIDNSLRYYYPGQTDYQPKIRLGGKLIPLYAYLRHRNIFFNFFIKLLIPFLKPDNFDKEIRK
ncbi:MAG: GNAT family N-acetyltransferase [Candidatus Omnitrophica bacterium]|jgi:predicted N-acyltransferase|nr:GNAT family N-acetyltransferase [Candidatus Omnitrophota bacterium]MDD5660579.1 GNAT family N-acetyltransferase [Candidatus Omnitrophota bacterium]